MLGVFEVKLNNHMLYQKDFLSDSPFISTRLNFYTPSVSFFKWEQNEFNEWYRRIGIQAPTIFLFHKADFFWSLNVSILGFGISLAYQNGY